MANDPFAKWRTSGESSQNNDPFAKWRTGNPETNSEGSYLRMAAQIPRNIASGAMGLGDLASMAANYGLRKAGVNYQFGYPSEEVAKGIDTLTGGYTTPRTTGERLAESGTKAVADTLAQAATGAGLAGNASRYASKLGRGLAKINPTNPSALAATGAGATAGRAYQEANPNNQGSLEGIAGSLGTGLAADIGTRTALGALNPRSMAGILKINPKNVEAFHGMGISPTLGQASDHPLIKSAENTIKNISPTSELRNATAKQYEHMVETLGTGAKGLAHTEQEAGKNIKSAFKEYGKKASDVTEKLKNQYMKKVAKAPTDLIDVTDSLHYFEKLEHELGTATARSELKNTAIGKQYEALRKRALENRGTVPLSDLEEFRRTLFDEISKGELGSVSKGRLSQLRGKLNDDIKDYMHGIGASKEWNRYNKFYSQWAEKRKPHLVEAKEIPDFEANKIFDSIGHSGKLDRSLLDTVYASQKRTTQKETLDALMQKMAKKGNEYDIHLLAKRISNQPKETKDLLFKPLSSPMRNKVESVIRSIDKMKELATYGNPSRTAYTEATKAMAYTGFNTLIGRSPVGSLLEYVLSIAATSAISKGMFANPRFINWAYRGTKIKNPKAMEYHIKGLKGILGRPAYQEIIHNLNRDTEGNHYAAGGGVRRGYGKGDRVKKAKRLNRGIPDPNALIPLGVPAAQQPAVVPPPAPLQAPPAAPPQAPPVVAAAVPPPQPDPGVFKYLQGGIGPEKFGHKHIRHVERTADPTDFMKQAQAEAQRRYTQGEIPASTLIGMNRRQLKDLKIFIKNPTTQAVLGAGQPVTFPVQHTINPLRTARAIDISQNGTKEYTGPGFTGFTFQSLGNPPETYTHPRTGRQWFIPNHLVGAQGVPRDIKPVKKSIADLMAATAPAIAPTAAQLAQQAAREEQYIEAKRRVDNWQNQKNIPHV